MLWSKKTSDKQIKTALVLSGGGARAAYQVGVLKALADILPKETSNPFAIISGTSAGAINATALAIYAGQFREAVWRLVHVWRNFRVHHVFRSDMLGLTSSSVHWVSTLALGGLGKYNPVSLLDRSPLVKLLNHYLPFERIQQSIDSGILTALCINASNYKTGNTVAFFQATEDIMPWKRARLAGVRSKIGINHLMASSAIPFLFAAEKLDGEYYGDGSMRQTAPTNPALHLGADRLFVIGVKHEGSKTDHEDDRTEYPSLGQVTGHVLDSIFLDNLDLDLERLQRINKIFSQIPDKHLPGDSKTIRKVDVLAISPSRDLDAIAAKYTHLMPISMRFFLRGLGVSKRRGSNLISYLLFEKAYCRELISLGYADTIERRQEILEFLDMLPDKEK